MLSRLGSSITRAILVMVGVCILSWSAVPQAYASPAVECAIPMASCLPTAGEKSCPMTADLRTLRLAVVAPEEPQYEAGIPVETLSLYKTVTYVTGATLTDQLWYLIIASAAATTGGLFFGVNAATSSMMTYSYEYAWTLCCKAPPGPDGVVPVSITKAVIYRGLSIIRVGGLALLFGNTLPSSAIVTGAITLSRTAVYMTNDYVWNSVDVRKRTEPVPATGPIKIPSAPLVSVQLGAVD
ncbi:MAG: hypothetical protein HQ481_01735 [Alphaproteobacteria bacterium]|nr:hypothetical protein [Alphaproteobacteria bacterium]